jgi:hypothetical protein
MRIGSIIARSAAVGLSALAAVPLVTSAATVPKLQIPSVTTPPVGTPAVTVPSASTPSVSAPAGGIPSVHVPSVSTPSVNTPVGKLPSVTIPSLSTPSARAPSLSTPSASTSSGTPWANTPAGSTPSLTTSPASAGAGTAGSSAGAAGAAGAAGSPSPAGSQAGFSGRSADARASRIHSGSGPPSSWASASSAATENRRLRSLVTRYDGCLTSLTPQSQRLLSLRAGLRGGPRSAGATARILRLSPGRERLVEQASLLALQTAGGGGCAGSASGTRATGMTSTLELVDAGHSMLTASSTGLPTLSSQPSASLAPGASHAGVTAHKISRPVLVTPAAKRTIERALAPDSPFPAVAVALFAALLVGTSLVLLPGIRRRLMPVAGSVGGTRGSTYAPRVGAGAIAPANATAPAPGANGPRPASHAEPRPELPAGDSPAKPPPETHPQNGHSDPIRGGSRAEWAREHATQAALVAGVIAGGAVRLVGHARSRRS